MRRGYFVGGVGATQFALPAALDLLRSLTTMPDDPEVVVLAATDPANPYGTILKWPAPPGDAEAGGRGPTRTVGALVVLVNGTLAAYISRGGAPADASSCRRTSRPAPRRPRAGRPTRQPHAARRQPHGAPDRRDQRHPRVRAPAAPIPDRSRLQPVRHGLPDAAACLKATRSSAPRARCIARSAGKPVVTAFESCSAGAHPRPRRRPADRPHGRTRAVDRQAHPDALLRRPVLRTHMRMNGSWHIYRPGEPWQTPRRDMRIIVATADFEAVGFNVPVAEFLTGRDLAAARRAAAARARPAGRRLRRGRSLRRVRAQRPRPIADVLLNQRVMAGVGNVYKSEVLFACGVNPFRPRLGRDGCRGAKSDRDGAPFLQANVSTRWRR